MKYVNIRGAKSLAGFNGQPQLIPNPQPMTSNDMPNKIG